ncbi:hypothetical protein HNP55_001181 [Paucibacter oligotrophus]|uniref:DUF3299 domain-containing protein n=1 Tax=Roseateles oligotrophus TaxID=1769250 RepID=A0A840L3Y5_9BURK|nr:DUF3299 domain-containing protein [Roseateles oligotrophus]MBB4842666.1 hypothetical protein [Roseateles oligotrophus]
MWRPIAKQFSALSAAGAAVVCLLLPPPAAAQGGIDRWEALVPQGWNPYAKFGVLELGRLQDGSPEANEMMQQLRETLDAAPTRPELEGRPVRLPGYVVPLQTGKAGLSEFLLVPYFGACIHTPPPPANQIVYVRLAEGQALAKTLRSMSTVRVSGRLTLARQGSASGESGYRIDGARIEAYR